MISKNYKNTKSKQSLENKQKVHSQLPSLNLRNQILSTSNQTKSIQFVKNNHHHPFLIQSHPNQATLKKTSTNQHLLFHQLQQSTHNKQTNKKVKPQLQKIHIEQNNNSPHFQKQFKLLNHQQSTLINLNSNYSFTQTTHNHQLLYQKLNVQNNHHDSSQPKLTSQKIQITTDLQNDLQYQSQTIIIFFGNQIILESPQNLKYINDVFTELLISKQDFTY